MQLNISFKENYIAGKGDKKMSVEIVLMFVILFLGWYLAEINDFARPIILIALELFLLHNLWSPHGILYPMF